MKTFSPPKYKISLSLDPAFEVIWWSLIWFFLLMSVFSASTFQTFNWGTPIFLLVSGILFAAKKMTFVTLDAEKLSLQYFGGLKEQHLSVESVAEVQMNAQNRFVKVTGKDGKELLRFHLSKKNQKKLWYSWEMISPTVLNEVSAESGLE